MIYTKNIHLEKEKASRIEALCTRQPESEDECFTDKEAPITFTAEFPGGYSMDVKVCGTAYEPGGDNVAWTEAVLFKDGFEVCCTEPCEDIWGTWTLSHDNKEFVVNVLCSEDMKKADPIILLVGPSGSGKSTIADILEKQFKKKQVVSYTTRPSRGDGDIHHFVSSEEFAEIKDDMCAYTLYNGNEYGASSDEVEVSDVYVIDPAGVRFFAEHYNGKRPYRVFTLACDPHVCYERMLARGDTKEAATQRLENDRKIVVDHMVTDFPRCCSCKNTRIDVSDITASQAARFIMTIINEEVTGTPYCLTPWEADSVYRKVDRRFLENDIRLHLNERLECYKDDENTTAINVVQELIDDPDALADFVEHTIGHSDSYFDAYWTCVDFCIDDQIRRELDRLNR